MSIASLYPSINPSLLLDFANVKRLDPRITFTRTTTATYYDGVTTAKAEENLLTNSAAFTPFTTTGSSLTANSTTAPDGTSTAYTLTEDTANSTHRLNWGSPPSGSAGALSVYAKANSAGRYLYISTYTTAARIAIFDLSGAGTVTQSNASSTATITSVGNGWYRCSVSVNETVTYLEFGLSNATTGSTTTAPTYTGNGSSMYIWGPQFELRNAVTAYTATTTQAITNYIPVLQTAAAGQARFDHNPTTGESLGLLIEEARTNKCLRSEEFGTSPWATGNASITPNTIVAPDGNLTGDKFVEDAVASTDHAVVQSVTVTAGANTFSVYVKAAGRTKFQLREGSNGATADYDLASPSSGMTDVGNGWYRCVLTATPASTTFIAQIYLKDNSGNKVYIGNGFSGLYLWGAQLEAGSFPTSYIATTSASVTRNADAASMTGTNFSSWFNNGEGTVYADYDVIGSSGNNQRIYSITDSAGDGYYGVKLGSTIYNQAYQFGAAQASLTATNTSLNTSIKNIFGVKTNDFAACTNAASPLTDTTGLVAAPTTMYIGTRSYLDNQLGGHIRKLAYYPVRCTNAQLQALTA